MANARARLVIKRASQFAGGKGRAALFSQKSALIRA
jgi:hypothetical protein